MALGLPVGALVQDDEVIATHMPDKITLRVTVFHGNFGHQPNHFIATPVAVLVVEGFEVVQIGVTRDKLHPSFQQPFDVLADGNVAGQKSQGVGVARRFNPGFGHRANQLLAGANAFVAAVVDHDKPIHQVALVIGGQDADQLVHIVVALDQTRRQVGMHPAGFAAPNFAVKEFAVLVHEARTVDDANRAGAVHQRDGVQLFVGQKDLGQRVVAGVKVHRGGLHHRQPAERAGVGGAAQLGENRHAAVHQHRQRRLFNLLTRQQGRPAQKIPLTVGDAQVPQNA